tara:strand:- start:9085 stop:9702 length:618 start_codon:yes stop_codon:yes gene_type:complete
MSINSKEQLCNMASSHLGNYGTVSNIDSPTTEIETTYSLWYDVSRQTFLKTVIPNFSMTRKRVAQLSETPPYPFAYVYEYPKDCLKVLGIGAVEDKLNNYTVENNRIYTDILYSDGMPIRYIRDVTDVTDMSPEFKTAFSWYLASAVALEITQDISKMKLIEQLLPEKMSSLSGINAQENKPIRISRSQFKEARYSGFPRREDKR